jgi:hypothetical protein
VYDRRLEPKSAFSRFPPVHRADLEGQLRDEGGPWHDAEHQRQAKQRERDRLTREIRDAFRSTAGWPFGKR